MTDVELHETVSSLASLLKHTTEKRLVWPEGVKEAQAKRSFNFNSGDSSSPISDYDIIEPTVEYHNVLFSPEQVETIKRKFLKLVEQL